MKNVHTLVVYKTVALSSESCSQMYAAFDVIKHFLICAEYKVLIILQKYFCLTAFQIT